MLEEIHSPADIKNLSLRELTALAAEMRAEIGEQANITSPDGARTSPASIIDSPMP